MSESGLGEKIHRPHCKPSSFCLWKKWGGFPKTKTCWWNQHLYNIYP